jgi:hypothetical protein
MQITSRDSQRRGESPEIKRQFPPSPQNFDQHYNAGRSFLTLRLSIGFELFD